MTKMIKNEQWQASDLFDKIKNNEIRNPKFQRKRKWCVLEANGNTKNPSEDRYIEFLIETGNSVHAISVGCSKGVYINIDGNNRINAIVHFLEKPFDIFPQHLLELSKFVVQTFSSDANLVTKINNTFNSLSYIELMEWKAKHYFKSRDESEFYNKHLKTHHEDIEDHIERIQQKLKTKNGNRFDTHVKVNVNVFEGYNTDDLCHIFEKINKYNSCLTESELLASRLYSINDFVIHDIVLKAEIIKRLEVYYCKKNENERLTCYSFTNDINAFDFMAGFQNYAYSQNQLFFEEFTNDGVPLFFKIFKKVYNKQRDDYNVTFTTENVNSFIRYITQSIVILLAVYNNIYMKIAGGTCFNHKLKSFGRNNLYLLIITIVGHIDKQTQMNVIVRGIEKVVMYHLFVEELTNNKEKKSHFRAFDGLHYEAGGAYIDNAAAKVLVDPDCISDTITKEKFGELIDLLNLENVNAGAKNKKRRTRRFYEKTLLYYYYRHKVPAHYLDKEFWLEHIIPFSAQWDCNVWSIDIDRLGNTVPIVSTLNSKRNNKHISEYSMIDDDKFMEHFKEIVPSADVYDSIVKHDGRKLHVVNGDNFNQKCIVNETLYKNNFVNHLC